MKNRIVAAIATAASLTALYLAAPFLPRSTTWGFHFLAFLGPAAPFVFLAAVLLLLAAAANRRTSGAITRGAGSAGSRRFLVPAVALSVFAATGFLFRVRIPLLGDSWFLVRNFAGAIQGTEVLLPRDEPLATLYFSAVTDLLGVKTYGGFLNAFFAGDMVLGAAFILAAWATVRTVFNGGAERLVSFLLLCTLPAMLLFFGYVETYSSVLLMLSLYLLSGVRFLRGRLPFAWVALAFLLQVLTHYLTVLMLPSLLYLAYAGWKRGQAAQVMTGAAAFAAGALLALASVGFDVGNYFSQVPHRHYLPIVTPESLDERYSSPYTMFSPLHLLDLANLTVLLGGAAVILLLSALVPGVRGRNAPQGTAAGTRPGPGPAPDVRKFLFTACGPVVCFTLVAKFDLGTARDWDVVAPYSYLLTLTALAVYFRRVPAADDPRPALVAGGMGLICSLLWFTVNSSPAASIERFTSLLDPDLLGQGGMYNGSLYLSRYYRQAGAAEEKSAALWERYLDLYPGDVRGYRNVVVNMRGAGAEAVTGAFARWLRTFGDNPVTRDAVVNLSIESGNLALGENRLGDAGRYYAAALAADSGSASGWNNLGIVLARRGDFGTAARYFARAVEIDTAFADAWFNLGRSQVALGDPEGGRTSFLFSARFGNDAARKILSDTTGR